MAKPVAFRLPVDVLAGLRLAAATEERTVPVEAARRLRASLVASGYMTAPAGIVPIQAALPPTAPGPVHNVVQASPAATATVQDVLEARETADSKSGNSGVFQEPRDSVPPPADKAEPKTKVAPAKAEPTLPPAPVSKAAKPAKPKSKANGATKAKPRLLPDWTETLNPKISGQAIPQMVKLLAQFPAITSIETARAMVTEIRAFGVGPNILAAFGFIEPMPPRKRTPKAGAKQADWDAAGLE